MLSKIKNPIVTIIGSGSPHVAVVACLHGDEKFGLKVLNGLKRLKINEGTLSLIIANPYAIKKNKRFIETDLNRSFPGKTSGSLEQQIAHILSPLIRKQDAVIDLHATRSDFESVGIIVRPITPKLKCLLKATTVSKIMRVNQKKFGRGALIGECKNGISLEYGRAFLKKKKNAELPLKDTMSILRALTMIDRKNESVRKKPKEVFDMIGVFEAPPKFKESPNLREFAHIKRGTIVGHVGTQPIRAKRSFSPAFLGKGKYKGIAALMLKKSSVRL